MTTTGNEFFATRRLILQGAASVALMISNTGAATVADTSIENPKPIGVPVPILRLGVTLPRSIELVETAAAPNACWLATFKRASMNMGKLLGGFLSN